MPDTESRDMEQRDKLSYIKKRHDQSQTATEDIRERGASDLLFARFTQWDDTLDSTFTEYRGEFNILRPARRRIVSGMRENDISIKYAPDDGADPDGADVLNGMYRTSVRENVSQSAINIAIGDQIDCGFGAWRLVPEYSSNCNDLDNTQVIKRIPIHEANNTVYWDPDAKNMDKSDARYCTILTQYTRAGFGDLLDDLDISEERRHQISASSFATPEESYVYPWSYGNAATYIHVGEYYEIKEKKEKVFIYLLPNGDLIAYTKKQLAGMAEQPEEIGAVKRGEKARKRKEIFKYLLTGGSILEGPIRIAGQNIPVVPVYGEWFFVEGVESWEGITRLAKDPCRLRNMMFSYLADIVGKGARRKPFFYPEQVAGWQKMYDTDNNFPYYFLNSTDEGGNQLPPGPISYMENQQIPPALQEMIALTTDSVDKLTPKSVDASALKGSIASNTVDQVNRKADEEMYMYLDNIASAHRRDAEIFGSMAQELFDIPREVTLTDEAGVQTTEVVQDEVTDLTTMDVVTLNDLRKGRFVPEAKIGQAYSTQKDENRAELKEIVMTEAVDPAIRQIATLQYFAIAEGSGMQIIRDYADTQLVLQGHKEPSNDKQRELLAAQQQQQSEQQDPNMVFAEAERLKAETVARKSESEVIKNMEQAEKTKAETYKILIEADEASAGTFTKQLDNAERLANVLRVPGPETMQ